MSIGVSGLFASVAGAPLAQANGPDVDRSRIDSAAKQRANVSQHKAAAAAGIGAADGEDHDTQDRDADGRRPWEIGPDQHALPAVELEGAETAPPTSRDPSGDSGNGVDFTA